MLNKRNVVILISAIIVVWIGSLVISRIMVSDKNPSRRYAGIILGEESDKILRRACFNCHSNETEWPWYTSMPVISVLISSDVGEARKHLNFSDWESIPEDQRIFYLKMVFKEIEQGEMPPFIYKLGHPEAKLKENDLKTLKARASSLGISFDSNKNSN
jgi:hypothetical protein